MPLVWGKLAGEATFVDSVELRIQAQRVGQRGHGRAAQFRRVLCIGVRQLLDNPLDAIVVSVEVLRGTLAVCRLPA